MLEREYNKLNKTKGGNRVDLGILISIVGFAFSLFTFYYSKKQADEDKKRNEEREKEMQELKEMVRMCLAILESQRKIK